MFYDPWSSLRPGGMFGAPSGYSPYAPVWGAPVSSESYGHPWVQAHRHPYQRQQGEEDEREPLWAFNGDRLVPVQRTPATQSQRSVRRGTTRSSRSSNAGVNDSLNALAQLLGAFPHQRPSQPRSRPAKPSYMLNAFGQPVPIPSSTADRDEDEDADSNSWDSADDSEQEHTTPPTGTSAGDGSARQRQSRVRQQPQQLRQPQQAPSQGQPHIYLVPDPRQPGVYVPVAVNRTAPQPEATPPLRRASSRAGSLRGRRPPATPDSAASKPPSAPRPAKPTTIPVTISQAPQQATPVTRHPPSHAAAPAPAVTVTAEREPSTHLVLRPSYELSLSRDPSLASLQQAQQAGHHRPSRHARGIPVQTAGAAHPIRLSKPGHSKAHPPSSTASAAGADNAPAAAAAAAAAAEAKPAPRPAASMTKSQAARLIQRWWRGHRIRSGSSTTGKTPFKALCTLNKDLQEASAKLYQYLAASDGNITHKQFLEVSELAMRCVLGLDGVVVHSNELRAMRKHLTKRSLSLHDQVQAAYAASSKSLKALSRAASMRVPSTATPAASASPAPPAPAPAPNAAATLTPTQPPATPEGPAAQAVPATTTQTSTATEAEAAGGGSSGQESKPGPSMGRENSEGWSKLAAAVNALGLQAPGGCGGPSVEEGQGHQGAGEEARQGGCAPQTSDKAGPAGSPTSQSSKVGEPGEGGGSGGGLSSPFAAVSGVQPPSMPVVVEDDGEGTTGSSICSSSSSSSCGEVVVEDSVGNVSQEAPGAKEAVERRQDRPAPSVCVEVGSSIASIGLDDDGQVHMNDGNGDAAAAVTDAGCAQAQLGVEALSQQLAGLSQQKLSQLVRVVLRLPGQTVDCGTQTD